MNKSVRKLLVPLLCLTLLSGIGQVALAEEATAPPDLTSQSDGAANKEESPVAQPSFLNQTGTVIAIEPALDPAGNPVEGASVVMIETVREGQSDPLQTNFIVSADTVRLNDGELKVGATLSGWYDARLAMILIYPARLQAVAITVDAVTPPFIKLDSLDADLVTADGSLQLIPADTTQIVNPDGSNYQRDLVGSDVAILYAASTRSIPAQTTPSKIIVLHAPVPRPQPPTAQQVASAKILVNGTSLNAPSAILNGQGVILVPLRAIAEAIGYEVVWSAETRSVTLGRSISLTLDQDLYTYMRTAPITLGTAPQLIEGTTYVPLSFFSEVARHSAVFAADQIEISAPDFQTDDVGTTAPSDPIGR